jgi:dUTP pyrophosphatase
MDARLQHTALPVQRLDPRAILPTRAHPGDAGLDLHALEPAELEPGERASIPTGIAVAIPEGYAGLVLPRSGLAARHGISLVNAPGLIDAGYRGEIRVLLVNTDPSRSWTLQAGERIAQLVISPVVLPDLEEVTELSSTSRGVGGFGSSGM